MKAQKVAQLTLLAGPRKFVILVVPRDYSWDEAQCQQLLQDGSIEPKDSSDTTDAVTSASEWKRAHQLALSGE